MNPKFLKKIKAIQCDRCGWLYSQLEVDLARIILIVKAPNPKFSCCIRCEPSIGMYRAPDPNTSEKGVKK